MSNVSSLHGTVYFKCSKKMQRFPLFYFFPLCEEKKSHWIACLWRCIVTLVIFFHSPCLCLNDLVFSALSCIVVVVGGRLSENLKSCLISGCASSLSELLAELICKIKIRKYENPFKSHISLLADVLMMYGWNPISAGRTVPVFLRQKGCFAKSSAY